MKKVFLLIVLILLVCPIFAQTILVEQYTGDQWEKLDLFEKMDIVSGFLAGFSVWRDYVFDLDTEIYKRYLSYNKFLERNNVVKKIVSDLDRYYKVNREYYKYNDRVVTMIIVFYGKYWWMEINE